MAQIAHWGSVIRFYVSSEGRLTFSDFKRKVSGRWKSHNILNAKPKSEFTGASGASVTLKAVIAAENGVSPKETLKILEKASEKGKVAYLYVGGEKVGENKFYLDSISETWSEIWNKGELARVTVSLTFTEYT